MFYENLKKFKKTTEKNLTFSIFESGVSSDADDSISKPTECKNFYNLTYNDGALKTGLGFKDLEVPTSVTDLKTTSVFDISAKVTKVSAIYLEKMFSEAYDMYVNQIMVLDSDFKVYGLPLLNLRNNYMVTRSDKLTAKPIFCTEYRVSNSDVVIFFTKNETAISGQTINAVCANVPPMISCVVHYGNFFGIKNDSKNTLIYTKNTDLRKWTENETTSTIEFLDNRGVFIKLVAFNDYVYLFREKGITKISIYTSKEDFSVTHLYTSSSRIFENSICVCGDKVFFMTRDGLYSFNGTTVTKICEKYDKYFKNLDNSNCSSACLDGKYYIATRCDFNDGETVGCEANEGFVNNVLFEVDLKNFELNLLRGVDIINILSVDCPYLSKLCACFNDKAQKIGELCFNGKDFLTNNKKAWQSYATDLGYNAKRKKLKELILTTKYNCEIEIISDEETKTYSFSGSDAEQRLAICVSGKTFQFKFKTDAEKCEICKPMIVFDVVS